MTNIDLRTFSVALGVAVVMAKDGGGINSGKLAIEIADMIEQICRPDSKNDNAAAETLPWTFTCFGKKSEIEAYSQRTAKLETIAEARSFDALDAEEVAAFIVDSVNNRAVGKA